MSLMNRDMKKIAIVRLSALGDIVNAAVVVQFIKECYPTSHLSWISEAPFVPLLESLAQLDAIHSVNIKQLKKERSLSRLKETLRHLRSLDQYDLIIDMQGLIKSAIVARLLGANTHGFAKDSTRESLAALLYKTTTTIPYTSGVVLRNCRVVAEALDMPIEASKILNKKAIFDVKHSFHLNTDHKNIAFVIGASWASKIYPKELVVEVCNALAENIYIIWGNEQEREVAAWITARTPYGVLAPKLNLSELVSYISHMDLLIGNDTGPTHMAWAQNIPSITLFGPTTSRMIYETQQNIGIKSPSRVDILKIDKHDFSIREIASTVITQKAKELLR